MRTFKLNNVTPSGTEADTIELKEIPSSGKYGDEFDITYQRLEFLNKYYLGKVCLLDGRITFYDDQGKEVTEMSLKGLKLLYDWIEQNKEMDEH
jgi:hypothetical protein